MLLSTLQVVGLMLAYWLLYAIALIRGGPGFLQWASAPTTFQGDLREQRPWFLV